MFTQYHERYKSIVHLIPLTCLRDFSKDEYLVCISVPLMEAQREHVLYCVQRNAAIWFLKAFVTLSSSQANRGLCQMTVLALSLSHSHPFLWAGGCGQGSGGSQSGQAEGLSVAENGSVQPWEDAEQVGGLDGEGQTPSGGALIPCVFSSQTT